MRIAFDIDGVIAELDIPFFRIMDFIPCKEEEKENIYHYYYAYRPVLLNPKFFTQGQGDEVIIITARPERYKEETIDWLKRHDIKYSKFIMLNHEHPTGKLDLKEWFKKQARKKAKILIEEKIDVYFEDTPLVVKYLREMLPDNIKVIQFGLRSMKHQ